MFGRKRFKGNRGDLLSELVTMIDEHGWAVRNVVSAEPSECFLYTVGLTRYDHPEAVMTGLPPDAAKAFLNIVGQMAKEGHRFEVGSETSELSYGPAFPIIRAEDVSGLTAVQQIYGEVRAIQIIWRDSQGNFPWSSAFGNPAGTQPLLGSPAV